MDIGSILQRSWDIAWRYKSLWIFGLFIEGIGGLNSAFSPGDAKNLGELGTFSSAFWALFMVASFIGLIFLIMHFISSAAHIDAINKLTRGGTYTLGSSFSVGVDYFWRFVGLGLLLLGAIIALMLVIALPVVLLFFVNKILGFLSLVIFVPLTIAGIVLILLLYHLAQRPVVIRGSSIGDALDEAYYLFRAQLPNCIKFILVIILVSIIVGFAIFLLLAAIAAPFVGMVIADESNLVLALILGIPLVLVVMLFVDGIFGSFFHSAYTLFYFKLLELQAPVEASTVAGGPTY